MLIPLGVLPGIVLMVPPGFRGLLLRGVVTSMGRALLIPRGVLLIPVISALAIRPVCVYFYIMGLAVLVRLSFAYGFKFDVLFPIIFKSIFF